MKEVTLYLTHGHVITFRCEDFVMNVNTLTGKYSSVEWKKADRYLSFRLDELIAYEVVEVDQ